MNHPSPLTPAQEARLAMRAGQWTTTTKHTLPGYAKCNLVIVPQADAADMLLYCQRNPRPCPLIEITNPGQHEPIRCAPGADLRTDLSRYAIYIDGQRQEDVTDIRHLWRDDLVCFLIGSGTTWDPLLADAGIPQGQTWLYESSIATLPAGRIQGPMVVTMRLMAMEHVQTAIRITRAFPKFHADPIHIGSPLAIGVDLSRPMVGQAMQELPAGLTPVFWACGVTPQLAAQRSRLPLMITHAPTHGFVTDITLDQARKW